MGIYIEPDYDRHRISFYRNPEDTPDFVEVRIVGKPDRRFYDRLKMHFLPPDTMMVIVEGYNSVLKIDERNFKILLCEEDSSGYLYGPLSDYKYKYPDTYVTRSPKDRGYKIKVGGYFYRMCITDSLGKKIFETEFKDPDEIGIPR